MMLWSSLATQPTSLASGVKTRAQPPGTGVGVAVGSRKLKDLPWEVGTGGGVLEGVGVGGMTKRGFSSAFGPAAGLKRIAWP
jgi:hypothetical protein